MTTAPPRSARTRRRPCRTYALVITLAVLIPTATMAGPLTDLFNTFAGEAGVTAERALAYGPGRRGLADVYRPTRTNERLPIIVFYYGGSWTSGERATFDFVGQAFAARGYTTVVPDYRLFPQVRFPDFVDDARHAFLWAVDRYGCDGRRPVIVAGHSAGAWLAAMVAYEATGGPRPAALIGLAGPYAFDPTTWATTREIFAPAAANPDHARPVAQVSPGAPPTLLAIGAADTTVKAFNAEDLAAALQRVGTPVTSHTYANVGHVGLLLAMAKPLRWRASVRDDAVAFIERTVPGARTLVTADAAMASASGCGRTSQLPPPSRR